MADFTILPLLAISLGSLAFWSNCGFSLFWGAKRNRLLRNRVSAQQARERKKAYLSDLEVRVKDLEQKNSELDERLSTLQNENQMLRHVLSLPYFIFIIIIIIIAVSILVAEDHFVLS